MHNSIDSEWRDVTWEQALAGASGEVARLLETALAGGELGLPDGLVLAQSEGDDLLALVKVADELRRRVVGDRVTYVVNRNLNFYKCLHRRLRLLWL